MTDTWLFQPVIRDICSALSLQQSSDPAAGYPGSCAVFVVDEQVVIKLYPPMNS